MPELLRPRSKAARGYPAAAKALRAEVERVAAAKIEPKVERRAQALAEQLYRSRNFKAVQADDSALKASAADSTQEAPDVREAPRTRVPRGLTQRDLDRPWGRGGAPNIRRPRG